MLCFQKHYLRIVNQFLLISIVTFGMFMILVSCKKSEEIEVADEAEEILSLLTEPDQEEKSLGKAMKKTSRDVRRLSRALEAKDWVEIEMWADELKRGIGQSCVNLYIKSHPGVSGEFIILSDRFYNAANRLTLSCNDHDDVAANNEFDKMVKSCEDCHEGYKLVEKDKEK